MYTSRSAWLGCRKKVPKKISNKRYFQMNGNESLSQKPSEEILSGQSEAVRKSQIQICAEKHEIYFWAIDNY